MSTVAIQGNASGTGTFTIAAPNSNTDRTLVLPDEAGTVLTSGTPLSSFPTGFANGITEADQWRLSTNITNVASVSVLDTNWERVDTDNGTYVGTGMSESSGVFTFPSTGKWLIQFAGYISVNGSQRYNSLIIQTTTNNSTYDSGAASSQFISQVNSNYTLGSVYVFFIFDVTDTANCKVRFAQNCEGTAGVIQGSTNENTTSVNFIRLGDT